MRIKIKLRLNLLSDGIPGVGQEFGGLVDIDVNFDKYGTPFIPGKRIKGLLRESARDLEDIGLLTHNVNEIFGESGKNSNGFKISNGYLRTYHTYLQYFNYLSYLLSIGQGELLEIFNPMAIIDYFTYNRAQTAVIYKKGVAREKSLRFSRVLRKDLEFDFNISFNQKYKEDIENTCKVTRHFGTSRTRGFGHIKIELIESGKDKENASKPSILKEQFIKQLESAEQGEKFKLIIELINEEQLLVSNRTGRSSSTDFFISGSAILGSFAAKFIKENNNIDAKDAHKNSDFYNLFLSDKVQFSNFYPSHDRKVFYPHPYALTKKKDREEYYDRSFARPKDTQLIRMSGFSTFETIADDMFLYNPTISKRVEYHHKRPEDRSIGRATEGAGEFFQYEIIDPRHMFEGNIIATKNEMKLLLNLFEADQIKINIGKSRSAQYGSSIIKILDLKKISEDNISNNSLDSIYITLLSDMILKNENGHVVLNPSILENELAAKLEINPDELSIERKFLKFNAVGGFSNAYNLPKIQNFALGAGSEIEVKIKNPSIIDLNKLNGVSFGERISEGYGQVMINRKRNEKVLKKELHAIPKNRPENLYELKDIIRHILTQRLMYKLRDKAHKESDSIKSIPFSISFIQRIKLFIENSTSFDNLKNNLIYDKIPYEFELKIRRIGKWIYFDHEKGNFDQFNAVLEDLSDIGKITRLRDLIRSDLKNEISETFYKEDPLKYTLYKEYCKILLKDIQYRLR